MYKLTTEHSFDSAHFLAGYDGKCGNIHGHRWRVVVTIESEDLVEGGQCDGMVVDFGDLKRDVKALVDRYDHSLIVQEGTMRALTLQCLQEDGFSIITVPFRPTAERFAFYFYQELEGSGYTVSEVEVYETPNNKASYGRRR